MGRISSLDLLLECSKQLLIGLHWLVLCYIVRVTQDCWWLRSAGIAWFEEGIIAWARMCHCGRSIAMEPNQTNNTREQLASSIAPSPHCDTRPHQHLGHRDRVVLFSGCRVLVFRLCLSGWAGALIDRQIA